MTDVAKLLITVGLGVNLSSSPSFVNDEYSSKEEYAPNVAEILVYSLRQKHSLKTFDVGSRPLERLLHTYFLHSCADKLEQDIYLPKSSSCEYSFIYTKPHLEDTRKDEVYFGSKKKGEVSHFAHKDYGGIYYNGKLPQIGEVEFYHCFYGCASGLSVIEYEKNHPLFRESVNNQIREINDFLFGE